MPELVCKLCRESVSGPDEKDVKATMARHQKKKHAGFGGVVRVKPK